MLLHRMKHMTASLQPSPVVVDGPGLTIDDVVAVARHGATATLGDRARVAMRASAALALGYVVRGEMPPGFALIVLLEF